MSFSTTQLLNGEYLVEGTDSRGNEGVTVIDGTLWDNIKRHQQFHDAQTALDASFGEFYAPLEAAIDEVEATLTEEPDPLTTWTFNEGRVGVDAQDSEVVDLDFGAFVLRAIEEGHEHRLLWATPERLIITA